MSSGVTEERDSEGRPLRYVGHDEDVTGLHILREELTEAKRLAEERAAEAEALRGAGAVVVATLDAPTAVRSVIEQLKTLVPFDSALVCELDNRQLKLVGGSSDITERTWRNFAKRLLRPIIQIVQARIPDVVVQEDSDLPYHLVVPLVVRGTTVGIVLISRSGPGYTGEEVRIAMSMADYLGLALSNARIYARMQQRAEIDQLSGVLTRRAFMESAEQITDTTFHDRKSLSCIMLDIDHFKSINDTFGHPVGDQVIRMLGSVLRDSLRSSDVVGRFGGEEFCALLTDTTEDHAAEVAERLRADIASTEFGGVNRPVTASIGITSLRHEADDEERLTIEQLLKRADIALYNAKHTGRNRVIVYKRGMTEE
jgi:diguanylate cyclase (GGDEF)-like protein